MATAEETATCQDTELPLLGRLATAVQFRLTDSTKAIRLPNAFGRICKAESSNELNREMQSIHSETTRAGTTRQAEPVELVKRAKFEGAQKGTKLSAAVRDVYA